MSPHLCQTDDLIVSFAIEGRAGRLSEESPTAQRPRGERGKARWTSLFPHAKALRDDASPSPYSGCYRLGFLVDASKRRLCRAPIRRRRTPKWPRNVLGAGGVRVALASLTGVPQPLEDRLKDAFAAQASERNIALADPAKAAYLIRGYVTAYPAVDGTTIAAVYDVFDARKKRAQRLEDDVVVKSGGADSWSGFNAAAIEDLAAKSADGLAAFLVATPEALADAAPASGLDPGAGAAYPAVESPRAPAPRHRGPATAQEARRARRRRARKARPLQAASASRRSVSDTCGALSGGCRASGTDGAPLPHAAVATPKKPCNPRAANPRPSVPKPSVPKLHHSKT